LYALRPSPQANTPAPPGEAGYPPPAQTDSPVIIITVQPTQPVQTYPPTIPPLTPHPPPGWPTELPWPPVTSNPQANPITTPEIILFSTPEFKIIDKSAPDIDLDSMWYVFSPGINGELSLEHISIDRTGKRKEQPEDVIQLGTVYSPSIPQIHWISKPIDGFVVAVENFYGDIGDLKIIDITSGQIIGYQQPAITIGQYYDMSRDGKYFLGTVVEAENSQVALIGTLKGEIERIEYKDRNGVLPIVMGMAFSPDGLLIADAALYQPTFGNNNVSAIEIGIRDRKDLVSHKIICNVESVNVFFEHSLKWSQDGNKLMWIGAYADPDKIDETYWLWITDLETKSCDKVARLGIMQNEGYFIPGGYSADWSPDGSKIVYREGDIETGYRLILFDLKSGDRKDLIGTSSDVLSNIKFSPDGTLIAYNVFKKDHGEIWAVSLDGKESFPVAGPTTIHGPFIWIENSK
jgi:WD40 repeat protein